MKILFLADPNSIHTQRWKKSLEGKNIQVKVIGFSPNLSNKKEGALLKSAIIFSIFKINKKIKNFNPDIVHAHYASSYGLLLALIKHPKKFLSVWGSDVITFPKRSILHKQTIKFVLKKAHKIFATSQYLADETLKYTGKEINIIPFGIDTNIFKPIETRNDIFTVGTVKGLHPKYGVDTLIEGFAIFSSKVPSLKGNLLIVGGGPQKAELQNIVKENGIEDNVIFTGKVSHDQTVEYYNQMDVCVFLSNSEIFGFSVLEASACQKPVIASNIGGLKGVVDHNKTGFLVEPNAPHETAKALQTLYDDNQLRIAMGDAGRAMVKDQYVWNENVEEMIGFYKLQGACDPEVLL